VLIDGWVRFGQPDAGRVQDDFEAVRHAIAVGKNALQGIRSVRQHGHTVVLPHAVNEREHLWIHLERTRQGLTQRIHILAMGEPEVAAGAFPELAIGDETELRRLPSLPLPEAGAQVRRRQAQACRPGIIGPDVPIPEEDAAAVKEEHSNGHRRALPPGTRAVGLQTRAAGRTGSPRLSRAKDLALRVPGIGLKPAIL